MNTIKSFIHSDKTIKKWFDFLKRISMKTTKLYHFFSIPTEFLAKRAFSAEGHLQLHLRILGFLPIQGNRGSPFCANTCRRRLCSIGRALFTFSELKSSSFVYWFWWRLSTQTPPTHENGALPPMSCSSSLLLTTAFCGPPVGFLQRPARCLFALWPFLFSPCGLKDSFFSYCILIYFPSFLFFSIAQSQFSKLNMHNSTQSKMIWKTTVLSLCWF